MANKANQIAYVNIISMASTQGIVVSDPKSFEILRQAVDAKVIFVTETEFLFETGTQIARLDRKGFSTLTEYEKAIDFGFSVQTVSSSSYEEALSRGFADAHEYQAVTNLGFSDRDEYLLAKKRGFFQMEDELSSAVINGKRGMGPRDAFRYAQEYGFHDADHLLRGTSLGFTNGVDFGDAEQRGFPDAETYSQASQLQVTSVEDLQRAQQLGLNHPGELAEYDSYVSRYRRSMGVDDSYDPTDAEIREFLMYLSAIDWAGSEAVAFTAFSERVRKEFASILERFGENPPIPHPRTQVNRGNQARVRIPKNQHPRWLGAIPNDNQIRECLRNGTCLPMMARLDEERDTVQVLTNPKAISAEILVDASNVARFTNVSDDENTGRVRHLEMLHEKLSKLGFENVQFFADANLRYVIDDKARYEELAKTLGFVTVPARTEADTWILKRLNEPSKFVITNDQYSEHIKDDERMAERFNRARITFLIENDVITLMGIDKVQKMAGAPATSKAPTKRE